VRTDLGLSQEAFAVRYGIPVAALRQWEMARPAPDRATRVHRARGEPPLPQVPILIQLPIDRYDPAPHAPEAGAQRAEQAFDNTLHPLLG
jgi:transcriptional regulator with XRE-family HTH domain